MKNLIFLSTLAFCAYAFAAGSPGIASEPDVMNNNQVLADHSSSDNQGIPVNQYNENNQAPPARQIVTLNDLPGNNWGSNSDQNFLGKPLGRYDSQFGAASHKAIIGICSEQTTQADCDLTTEVDDYNRGRPCFWNINTAERGTTDDVCE